MARGRRRSLLIFLLCCVLTPIAVAATWNAAFEAIPANSESIGLADDRIRDFKLEVRNRSETEHDFGNQGNVTTDTGRHLAGSARSFVQSAAPSVDGTTAPNCIAEADVSNLRHCDAGRSWLDTDDNHFYVATDAGADGDADAWQAIKIDAGDVTSGTFANARISQSSVTQHQAALALTASQVSGLGGVQICDVTVAGATTISCAPFDLVTYQNFRAVLATTVVSGAGLRDVIVQTDADAGASYDGAGYIYTVTMERPGGQAINDSGSAASIESGGSIDATAGTNALWLDMQIATNTLLWQGYALGGNANLQSGRTVFTGGAVPPTGTINAIRFSIPSGTMNATLQVYAYP